jgi:transposase-like protein
MQSPYDPELRAEIRQRMNPPNRESVAEIARSTGVNAQTLYSWRHRWKQEGQLVPASSKAPELWSAAGQLDVCGIASCLPLQLIATYQLRSSRLGLII